MLRSGVRRAIVVVALAALVLSGQKIAGATVHQRSTSGTPPTCTPNGPLAWASSNRWSTRRVSAVNPALDNRSAACVVAGSTGGSIPLLVVPAGIADWVYVLSSTCTNRACGGLDRLAASTGRGVAVSAPPDSKADELLRFANVQDGIAVERGSTSPLMTSTLYATSNGAASWSRDSVGAGLMVLDLAASPSAYWAVVGSCPARAIECHNIRLVTSPAGSLHWRTVRSLRPWQNPGMSVTASGSNVWVSYQGRRDETLITESIDRGRTFSQWAAPELACVTSPTLVATSETTVWASCTTGLEVGYARSTDGGRSWEWLKLPITSGTGGAVFDPVTSDLAVFAHGLSDNRVYRVEGSRASVHVFHALPFSVNQSLAFASGADGFVIGSDESAGSTSLLRTTDGGVSWKHVQLP